MFTLQLTDHTYTVEELFDGLDLNDVSLPSYHQTGSECQEWMVAGEELRVSPNPETGSAALCNSDNSPAQNLQDLQNGCIAQNSATVFKDENGQPIGACCYNENYSPTYHCHGCGSCTCWRGPFAAECAQGWKNCGNRLGDGQCADDSSSLSDCCNSDTGVDGGNGLCPCGARPCGSLGGNCTLGSGTAPNTTDGNHIENYVGGQLQPLLNLPRLRGVWFPPPSVCQKSTTPPYFYSNTRYNPCVVGTPRPPLSGILTTLTSLSASMVNNGGSATSNGPLEYNQQFFEADVQSILQAYAPVTWSTGSDNADRVYE